MVETIILINSIHFNYIEATGKKVRYGSTYIEYTLLKGRLELKGTLKVDSDIVGYTVNQLTEFVQKELERNQVI